MDIIKKLQNASKVIASFSIDSKLLTKLKAFQKNNSLPRLSPLVNEILWEWVLEAEESEENKEVKEK